MRIVPKETLSPVERDALIAPLLAHNAMQGIDFTDSPFTIALENDAGKIVGGALGRIRWGWLYLTSVAVPIELRGQGWGRRLIEATELAARQRGCQYVWLDTYRFQARPFYEKLGYRVFGELPDHPPGHTRFFMFKALRSSQS